MTLLFSTAFAQIDEILERIVRAYESRFPERVSYYLIGSYADGSAVPLSDLDLILVFKGTFRDSQQEKQAHRLAKQLAEPCPVRLDITAREQDAVASMYAVIRVGLKQGSRLVYGEDLREQMTLPSHKAFIEDVIRGALFFIARLHDTEHIQTLPLSYPDANDPYYGYTRVRFAEWYPPGVGEGTKELVATVSRVATATAAVKTGEFIGSKQQGIQLFANSAGEPWATFVQAVYTRCKLDWNYLIPPTVQEQNELANLCEQMLEFENIFCRELAKAEIQTAS